MALAVLVLGAALAGGFAIRRLTRAVQSPRLLVIAAQRGDLDKLELALDGDVEVDAIPDGTRGAPPMTALEAAAAGGHVEAVKLLLEHEADPQPLLTAGWEVVEEPAWQAQQAVAKALLAAGAQPDVQDVHGNSAVHNAVLLGARGVLETLLEAGANASLPNKVGLGPAHLAIKLQEPELVRLIAGHMTKPDVFVAVYLGDVKGLASVLPGNEAWVQQSPPPLADYGLLHLAARRGESAVAEYLLNLTDDIDREEKVSGRTPLHWAAEGEHLEIVELLLARHADIEARAGDRTPMDLAAIAGRALTVERLLKAGATVNVNLIGFLAQRPPGQQHEGHARVIELLEAARPR